MFGLFSSKKKTVSNIPTFEKLFMDAWDYTPDNAFSVYEFDGLRVYFEWDNEETVFSFEWISESGFVEEGYTKDYYVAVEHFNLLIQ